MQSFLTVWACSLTESHFSTKARGISGTDDNTSRLLCDVLMYTPVRSFCGNMANRLSSDLFRQISQFISRTSRRIFDCFPPFMTFSNKKSALCGFFQDIPSIRIQRFEFLAILRLRPKRTKLHWYTHLVSFSMRILNLNPPIPRCLAYMCTALNIKAVVESEYKGLL